MKPILNSRFLRCHPGASAPLLALLCLTIPVANANPINGDLTVNGETITLNSNTTRQFKIYHRTDGVDFWHDISREWMWSYGGTPTEVMRLGPDNILRIFDRDVTKRDAVIIIDPGNSGSNPTIAPSIRVDGSEVLTVANSPTLLASDFVVRTSNNLGSPESFLMEGNFNGSGDIPTSGAGTRMMWYPEKAAFRAGHVSSGWYSDSWDDENVGDYSIAMGYNTIASGESSVAFGSHSTASGDNAFAVGQYSGAHGNSSFATGSSYAGGWDSVALGTGSYAVADSSFATGMWSFASGSASSAFGMSSTYGGYSFSTGTGIASGFASVSMGSAQANGEYSIALSEGEANGNHSLAVGSWGVAATSFSSVALGRHNENRYNSSNVSAAITSWQGDDEHSVFEVGVGTSDQARKNALTILQDGSVEVGKDAGSGVPLHITASGDVVLAKAQGDISMGIYGN